MQNQRGFFSTRILIAIVFTLIVLGGGTYYLVQQNSSSPVDTSLEKKVTSPSVNDSSKIAVKTQPKINVKQLPGFNCINLTKDLNTGAPSTVEVKQLQHFLNSYFDMRGSNLQEDGVFGPLTAQKVIELKKWPRFSTVTDKTSLVDSQTRKIISELTCVSTGSVTAEIEFDVSGFANDAQKTRIIVDSVDAVTTDIRGGVTLPGSYGSFNVALENPIQTKNLGIDFSNASMFGGCGKSVVGIAHLSNINQKLINDYPAGKALTMSAHLDSLTDVKVKDTVCGD
jgi:hypothetical protein